MFYVVFITHMNNKNNLTANPGYSLSFLGETQEDKSSMEKSQLPYDSQLLTTEMPSNNKLKREDN